MSRRAVVTRGAVWVVLALIGAGCGGEDSPPGDRVPQLASRLDAVGQAVSDRDFTQAQRQLKALVASTNRAREADEIDEDEADRILAAVAQLLATMPRTTVQVTPEVDEFPDADDDDDAKKLKEERKKLEEERKKLEEERKDEEDGGGNGGSSGNGPDDGEGD